MNQIEHFRREVARIRGKGGKPQRYPVELRAIAVAAVDEARRDGRSIASVARDLDNDHNTLRGWLGPSKKEGKAAK